MFLSQEVSIASLRFTSWSHLRNTPKKCILTIHALARKKRGSRRDKGIGLARKDISEMNKRFPRSTTTPAQRPLLHTTTSWIKTWITQQRSIYM